jgi:competence protein ComEA
MTWPRAAQRVLFALAAGLFALGVVTVAREARLPVAVPVADDPRLDVRLDLNSASAADLETLPGIGKALAGRIETHRAAFGPFRSVDDLLKVPGIGEKLLKALRPYVTASGH